MGIHNKVEYIYIYSLMIGVLGSLLVVFFQVPMGRTYEQESIAEVW